MPIDDLPPLNLSLRNASAWYDKATVRRQPRRTQLTREPGRALFPERLVPHLDDPSLLGLDDERREYLVAQHLFAWLSFTVGLEVSVVNRVTGRLADGSSGLVLPPAARQSAYQIYVDEGYHALFTMDVLHQIEDAYAIPSLPYDFQRVRNQLDAVAADRPELLRLVQILQVVVFETLVTTILEEIPEDDTVVSLVRETVADHAEDERVHHAYFSALFRELWPQLDRQTRETCARLLPQLIHRSVLPDVTAAGRALRACGIPEPVVREVLESSYSTAFCHGYAAGASRKTVRLFRACGVLDLPGADEAFAEAGLLLHSS